MYTTTGSRAGRGRRNSLTPSGVSAGTYGSATQVPQVTVDAQGLVTSASNLSIGSAVAYPDFTAPIIGNFSSVNPGSSSLTTTTIQGNSGLFFVGTAAAGPALRVYKESVASTWTRTMAFIPRLTSANFSAAGMVIRESGSSEIVLFSYDGDTNSITLSKWNSATSFNNPYSAQSLYRVGPNLLWFRINDDGTNLNYSYATDGKNFVLVHQTTRTDFATADECGFAVKEQNVTYSPAMTILSWA